jgi:hypothetical protein
LLSRSHILCANAEEAKAGHQLAPTCRAPIGEFTQIWRRLPPSFIPRAGNQLFAQLSGQRKAEILAQSEKELFYKIVKARISFENVHR